MLVSPVDCAVPYCPAARKDCLQQPLCLVCRRPRSLHGDVLCGSVPSSPIPTGTRGKPLSSSSLRMTELWNTPVMWGYPLFLSPLLCELMLSLGGRTTTCCYRHARHCCSLERTLYVCNIANHLFGTESKAIIALRVFSTRSLP